MADYKTMYYKLFNAITDAVEILQNAQNETEEMYIDAPENRPVILKIAEHNDTQNTSENQTK